MAVFPIDRQTARRPRQHGAVLGPPPRRALERAGWRTTLDYRENHQRGLDGRLLRVEQVWVAEAERFDDRVIVSRATGASALEAWERLLEHVETGQITRYDRVRFA